VYEVPMRKKNGEILWALISGAPIHNLNGDVVGSIGIHYDVSDKKKLIEDLAKAKKIAEDAQLAEKQFLANMSHEIRTPLNAIIGMAHLLYDTQPTADQREFLDVLKNSSNFLHSLISDILDMSKIEAGHLELVTREIDLVGIIRTQQKAFELKIEGRAIEVEALIDARLEGTFIGDELLINQVLNNLLSNAEKFTEKGVIGISVKQLQKQANDVLLQIQVYDTGMGIAPDQIDIIFNKFKQVNLQDRHKTKGTGLGLSIVKQLVELMGGEISVTSEPSKGTNFTFTLPLKRGEGLTLNRTVPNLKSLQIKDIANMKILMVEDNAMNRKYLGTLLERWKIDYDYAINGKEALPLVHEKKYDIILMDIQMPIMDGYETTLAIRNTHNKNQYTPVVALTASAMNNQKSQAFDVGMNDYLSKPFTPSQLLEKLQLFCTDAEANVENKVSESRYLSALDSTYLQEMYGDDYKYATDMFQTFITEIVPEVQTLGVETLDIQLLRKQIHKIKPTFGMVGLISLQSQLADLETACDKNGGLIAIENNLAKFLLDFHNKLPLLEQQLEKLHK
jgi:signal transduction histidine kinase/FixJ family two-component response regulator